MAPRPVAPRFTVPKWWSSAAREHDLSLAAVAVLFALCELGDDEWICEQSERNLAQHANISRSTVQLSLSRLVEVYAIVDLGRRTARTPQRFRVSPTAPPTAAQLRLLASPATRRATLGPDGAWLVRVE